MQVKKTKIFMLLVGLLLPVAVHASNSIPTVTVMADNSLSNSISKIARSYSQKKHVSVNTSFASQKFQQQQITDGAAADVLITTKQSWLDELKQQGLVDIYSQFAIAKNRLVLVGGADSTITIDSNNSFPSSQIIKASGGEPMFVVGHPETRIDGGFAKSALYNMGAMYDLEPYISYIKQIDQFVELITTQKAFGICLFSDTIGNKKIKIIGALPEDSHQPIIYNAVVIAGNNMNEARKFMEYLKSSEVRKILSDNGLEDMVQ